MVVTRSILRIALFVPPILTLALTAPVWAQSAEPADAEEMRREIRNLKGQLQALRAAITEAAEFDRMRANALARALGASPAVSESLPAKSPETGSRRAAAVSKPAALAAAAAPRRPAPVETPVGSSLRGRVEVPPGEPVAYVYVENLRGPMVREKKVIKQVDKQFVPRWAVVQHGTAVEFPNLDNIYHNVFSLSSGNSFDLGLYNAGSDGKAHTFEEAGAVDVYCNIHPQMAASLLVVPNRYYAKVKPDGSFEIAGVPVGRRKVVAWAPGSRLSADWVEVTPGAPATISLKLERKTGGHTNKQGRPYGSYE